MDIIELSQKMEADLLESHPKDSSNSMCATDDNFSPRLTRSQTNKEQKELLKETDLQSERKHRKVDEVEKINPNKKTKVLHKNLETIYEDPVFKKGNIMLLGTSKVKRSIYLDREFRIKSKQKSKLRRMKIKRLGKRVKPFKMSDEEFKSRMLRIDNFINGSDVKFGDGEDSLKMSGEEFESKVAWINGFIKEYGDGGESLRMSEEEFKSKVAWIDNFLKAAGVKVEHGRECFRPLEEEFKSKVAWLDNFIKEFRRGEEST